MSVKIGHASIDERGKASGGKAGDQTGKEVCTRQWYKKGWQYCLRPKSATVAERSAAACEAACANDSIGYDQSQRNTLHNLAKANNYKLSAVGKCETDCSALMTVCAIAGGVTELEHTGNAPTTSTMVAKFKASGAYDVLTADRYLSFFIRIPPSGFFRPAPGALRAQSPACADLCAQVQHRFSPF